MIEEFSLDDEPSLELHSLLRERIKVLETRLMSRLADEELTKLWDSFDGFETSDDDISGEMIRNELLRRGLET